MNRILEVCCGNLESVRAAVLGGAERIELCSALELDGLTPSEELIRTVKQLYPGLRVHVLIRPRAGDFHYSAEEAGIMAGQVEMALEAGARILGVNNRNLKDFTVDPDNSRRLRALIPPEVLFISESGVATGADVKALESLGADGALIGEALMRAPDRRAKLRELRGVT